MKLGDLIEYLKTCPQDMHVWLWVAEGGFEPMTYQDVAVRNGRVEIG